MSGFTMRLPDVGEGVAEAELVTWLVAVGDAVTTESAIAEVLTDKATVEIYPPVAGVVSALHGEPGDVLTVGAELIDITVDDADEIETPSDVTVADEIETPSDVTVADEIETPSDDGGTVGEVAAAADPDATAVPAVADDIEPEHGRPSVPAGSRRTSAAPAVRRRASSLGIDLATVTATGPDGRVTHADLDRELTSGRSTHVGGGPSGAPGSDAGIARPVRGIRRRIARSLADTWREVPHITYVEAVDVTELERLRATLNDEHAPGRSSRTRLTILPFLATAIARAVADQPSLNAHYDHATETLTTFDAVHVGIATQTDDGLLVPVVRHVERRDLRDLAAEIARVTGAAREGSATRDELTGSSITITSLGAMGGIATTPILNAPEVAIVGVNKIETRPVWDGASFGPRSMMNLSCSFDHRMVDGWDAATFVQRLKTLLETPALLFV